MARSRVVKETFLAGLLASLLAFAGAPLARGQQSLELVAPDAALQDDFGAAVSLSGARALIGAPHADAVEVDAGAAYLFELDDTGQWQPVAKLQASDATAGAGFGTSVSLDGDQALIGAPLYSKGAAYYFERQGDGTWLQKAKMTDFDAVAGDLYGWSVALSGDVAYIGAPYSDHSVGQDGGIMYAWFRNAAGTWFGGWEHQMGQGIHYGWSVALSDRHVGLVGALHGTAAPGIVSGAVYAYERPPTLGAYWLLGGKLLPSDASPGDDFGYAVSVAGRRALVGAPGDDTLAGVDAGSSYVFERVAFAQWVQVAKLEPHAAAPGLRFGASVSISGDRALVGALRSSAPGAPDCGSAYLFERQPAGGWIEIGELMAPDSATGDLAGCAVSLWDGDRALVGSVGDDTPAGPDAGAAHVFTNLP